MSQVEPDRTARVSTLELFFDLVFVFTVTQLTNVLVAGGDIAASVQVVVMFAVIWWMYDGYAWLTNAIATDHLRHRILLIGGMGAFLVIALAIPDAYDGEGLAFGIGYLAVIVLHAGMYVRGTSLSEMRAILRMVPFNLAAAGLVLVGGALGGDTQWVLWMLAAAVLLRRGRGRTGDARRIVRAAATACPDRVRLLALRAAARDRRGGGGSQESRRRSLRSARLRERLELAVGVALFTACEVGFRRTLGLGRSGIRVVAAVAALATIPLGTQLDAKAQVAALAAIVAVALAAEGARSVRVSV